MCAIFPSVFFSHAILPSPGCWMAGVGVHSPESFPRGIHVLTTRHFFLASQRLPYTYSMAVFCSPLNLSVGPLRR